MAKTSALLRYGDRWHTASELSFTRAEDKYPPLSVPALNLLLSKGLLRGSIAEVNGARSSARTSVCLHILAQATTRGEICPVIDLYGSFDPVSAQIAGVQLDRIFWVRCHGNAEHAIRAADLLLHAGGFGIVLLDLCDANPRVLNRIPLSYWYRFRRAIEHTPAILLICADFAQARSCSSSHLELIPNVFHWSGKWPFLLLSGIEVSARLRRASGSSPAPVCSLQTVV